MDTLKGRNILVVEDTDSNFELIRVLLSSIGATIHRAHHGEQALQKLSDNSTYDLIIMDIQLPGMDGYEVTRKIRETDIKIPIIANTAFAMTGENEKAIESGCDAFIPRPSDRHLLVDTVIRLILK